MEMLRTRSVEVADCYSELPILVFKMLGYTMSGEKLYQFIEDNDMVYTERELKELQIDNKVMILKVDYIAS